MGCSPARAWPGPKVPVLGVAGKPTGRVKADLGASGVSAFASKASEESVFLCPRRKALAEGGGSGSKSWGGVLDFFGGEELRVAHGLGLDSLGGDTWTTGVFDFGGEGAKPGVGGGGEADKPGAARSETSCWRAGSRMYWYWPVS